MGSPFTVSLVCWHDGEPLLRSIREAVSLHEQGISKKTLQDEQDENCRHALALSHRGDAIGCGRLLANGHICCIAVMPEWREQKVGTAIIEALINQARSLGYPRVEVDAPVSATSFFHGLGFAEQGEVFSKEGLPHIKMFLKF